MTRLDSIENLRKSLIGYQAVTGEDMGAFLLRADEIQAEIDSRFMELPVDRKGEKWRIGDTFTFGDGSGKSHTCTVSGVSDCEVFFYYDDHADSSKHRHFNAGKIQHVKPRTVEDVMSEYAELSASQDVKKYHEVSDELREIQREKFRDEPEREFFKEFNGYEFYIELPYDELCIGTEKAWVKRHSYSYMYRKPDGGTVYSCSSLCGYSRDWAIGRIEEEIARIESESQMCGDAE